MPEVIVVGGGPAGVTAALRARELGATVALVERGLLGGTCTNDGCVPTRVLAHAARLIRDAERFADYGLDGSTPSLDFRRLLDRTQRIVYAVQEKKQIRDRLASAGVDVFAGVGAARFHDPHTLTLGDGSHLGGERFILCAGGHARRIPFPGADLAITHSDVWSLQALPRDVAVIGGAATGCQLASVFAAFGTRTTLLERGPRLLPLEDDAVAAEIAAAFIRRGIAVEVGIDSVDQIERQRGRLALTYTTGGEPRTVGLDAVVLAVGWPANLEELNLPAAGVETERGYVRVDDTLRTSAPHIFAAGDITGRMMLVQSATNEGNHAAESAVLPKDAEHRHEIVAHGGFTDPEYAGVGLTEGQARSMHDCAVATVSYADLDRGVIDGRGEGVAKLVVDRATRRILGAHIVGEQAVEVVQIAAVAMRAGMPVDDLADVELAYPTYTAIVGLAARRALHDLEPTAQRRMAAEWEHRAG